MQPQPADQSSSRGPRIQEVPPASTQEVEAERAGLKQTLATVEKPDLDKAFKKIMTEQARREEFVREFLKNLSEVDINNIVSRIEEKRKLTDLERELFGDSIQDTAGSRALMVDEEGNIREEGNAV